METLRASVSLYLAVYAAYAGVRLQSAATDHAGAVDMARLVLQHGRDPATRQLAEEIIAGQTIEIESMTRRLAALRKPSGTGSAAEFPSLGGTRGP